MSTEDKKHNVKKSFPTTFIPIERFDGLSIDQSLALLKENGFLTPPDIYNRSFFVQTGVKDIVLIGKTFLVAYNEGLGGCIQVAKKPKENVIKFINGEDRVARSVNLAKLVNHNPYGPAVISERNAYYFIDGKPLSLNDIISKRIKNL